MQIFNINDKDYFLPTGWHEVTVNKYRAVCALKSEFKSHLDDLVYKMNVASIMLDCPIELIEQMYSDELSQINELLTYVSIEHDKTPISENFEIIINGQQYYFDFKLFSRQKGAQFIDCLKLQENNGTTPNLHHILACMIRPVIGKKHRYSKMQRLLNPKLRKIFTDFTIEPYSIQNRNERAELFDQYLTMDKAFPLVFFCLVTKLTYLEISAGYS